MAEERKAENPMRKIRMEKVTLNMGTGEAGPVLEKAKKILEKITGRKVIITKSKKRSTFGIQKGRPIGAKVTLRGREAAEFLRNAFKALDNRINPSSFDTSGNFSFGIHEYINIRGVKYDPEVGILGMDVSVTLERPGFRIKRRMIKPKSVGKAHRISRDEAMGWVSKEFGIEVTKGEE